jgi:hypothetical protein
VRFEPLGLVNFLDLHGKYHDIRGGKWAAWAGDTSGAGVRAGVIFLAGDSSWITRGLVSLCYGRAIEVRAMLSGIGGNGQGHMWRDAVASRGPAHS